jgi:hypothetical protein
LRLRTQYTVQEQHPINDETTVASAATATDTTITFDDNTFMVPTMVVKNLRTGEQFRAGNSAVIDTGAGTITNMQRSRGETAAAAMVVGDRIITLNTALAEGQDKIDSRSRSTGSHTNFAAMIEHDISISEQNAIVNVFGPSERARLEMQNLLEFRKMRNRSLLLSEPSTDATTDTNVVHTTGGLRWLASQFNNHNVGPGFTYDTIAEALVALARHGGAAQGREFWGITSHRIWLQLSSLPEARDAIRTDRNETTVGNVIKDIVFPGGVWHIMIDHNMEKFEDEILIFDLKHVGKATYIPVSTRDNVQTPGAHREEKQIFVQEGFRCTLPLSLLRLYNLQHTA